jgi:hypothetical protein
MSIAAFGSEMLSGFPQATHEIDPVTGHLQPLFRALLPQEFNDELVHFLA